MDQDRLGTLYRPGEGLAGDGDGRRWTSGDVGWLDESYWAGTVVCVCVCVCNK